jgi:hypothetical protein
MWTPSACGFHVGKEILKCNQQKIPRLSARFFRHLALRFPKMRKQSSHHQKHASGVKPGQRHKSVGRVLHSILLARGQKPRSRLIQNRVNAARRAR